MEFSRSLLRVENKQTGFRRTGFQVPTTGCTQLIHLILLHGEFSESKIQPSQKPNGGLPKRIGSIPSDVSADFDISLNLLNSAEPCSWSVLRAKGIVLSGLIKHCSLN